MILSFDGKEVICGYSTHISILGGIGGSATFLESEQPKCELFDAILVVEV